MDTPDVSSIATGLVVATANTGPVSKALTAVEHGAETFLSHNPELGPVLTAAEQALISLVSAHGAGVVWSIVSGLLPVLSQIPSSNTHV